jgi:glycolate dehydrogenase FAD-binding subunit
MIEQTHRGDTGDHSDEIIAAVQRARETKTPVYISAGGSKRDMVGRACDAAELNVSAHRGIVDYQPQELVITVRAGTPITGIIAALDANQQMLSFEPPAFGGRATVGGTLACNLSGPARPWGGSMRDAVLGVRLINGRGECLKFGGQVMKNVAGYDVSRLQAGALGTLGLISEISLKVIPRPQSSVTLRYDLCAEDAIQLMNRRAGEPKPLSGAVWLDDQLYLRLSGATSAVDSTARRWGGEAMADDGTIWEPLGEMTLPFFAGDAPLWRFSLQPSAWHTQELGATLIDWGGAQRWVRGEHARDHLDRVAEAGGGHVALFRGGDRRGAVRPPLDPVQQRLQQRLKASFDPDGILNPGRLYPWL